jgi:hypothetical protein
MATIEYWEVVKPFRVVDVSQFMQMAETVGAHFECDREGRIRCRTRPFETEHLPLESLYRLIQQHLAPGDYAVLRVEQDRDDDDRNVRYEKVYRDQIEPCVYSDDPNYRR